MAVGDEYLASVRHSVRLSSTVHDGELTDLINAARADLVLGGVLEAKANDETDPLIKKAVTTYVKAEFGLDNEDADRLRASYKEQRNGLSLTVDNGSEFADADGIERSARRKDAKRTTVYYCHAYSSCERGTNENINRMIRRQFPKGTDFDKVTAAEVKRVETWLNDYPREILGFMSSAEAFKIAFVRAA